MTEPTSQTRFLVTAFFHHDASDVAVLVDATDATDATGKVLDFFELDEDRAVEGAEVVRLARPEDEGVFQLIP